MTRHTYMHMQLPNSVCSEAGRLITDIQPPNATTPRRLEVKPSFAPAGSRHNLQSWVDWLRKSLSVESPDMDPGLLGEISKQASHAGTRDVKRASRKEDDAALASMAISSGRLEVERVEWKVELVLIFDVVCRDGLSVVRSSSVHARQFSVGCQQDRCSLGVLEDCPFQMEVTLLWLLNCPG